MGNLSKFPPFCDKQHLLDLARLMSRETLCFWIHEMVKQADDAHVCFINSHLPSLAETHREHIKRIRSYDTAGLFASLCDYASDIVHNVIFPFLNLADHFRLARTSRSFLKASGAPSFRMRNVSPWRKLVQLTGTHANENLNRLCVYASLTKLKIHTPEELHLQPLLGHPLHHLDLSNQQLTCTNWMHIRSMTSLRHLNLCECEVTDDDLGYLQHLSLSRLGYNARFYFLLSKLLNTNQALLLIVSRLICKRRDHQCWFIPPHTKTSFTESEAP